MGRAIDFRPSPFESGRVEASGRFIGGRIYWKLYYVENIFRVIINSVLSVQIGPDWWKLAVDSKIKGKAQRFKQEYLIRPWHTAPGSHEIYYIHLSDLNEIMRANSHLFLPVIPEIDSWIAKIEQLRLPRNIVAHMNFPNKTDRQRISVFYEDSKILVANLPTSLSLRIP